MEKLSIEQKAKAYDELLLKLQKAKVDDNVCDEMYYRVIDDIVPELKESEDEKILRHLKAVVKEYDMWTERGLSMNDVLAWLEKQGEQKQDPCEHCADKRLNCHNFPCIKKRAFKQGKSVLEALNEEKVDNANKVEPFDKYEGLTDFERTLADICLGWISEEESGWEQYINDGADVLLKIAIKKFNSVQEQNSAWSEEDECYMGECIGAIATKDGWSFEEKNKTKHWLKSLKDRIQPQPKQEWSKDDEVILGEIIDFFEKGTVKLQHDLSLYAAWLKSLKDRVLPQPKQEWSEEDENLLKLSFENLTELKDRYGEEYGKVGNCISWLNSLKQRYTWKPSDEQMKTLLSEVKGWKKGCSKQKVLESLYQDLKKLK